MSTCPQCGCTWTGHKITHCAQCHETFSTHANFDRHLDVDYGRQPPVKCRAPGDAGLVSDRNGYWRQPAPAGKTIPGRTGSSEIDSKPHPCSPPWVRPSQAVSEPHSVSGEAT